MRRLPPILLVAFALRLALAVAYPSFYRRDELFQTLEPAYRMITGWGVVSWEWREGIRSYLYPAFLAGLMDLPIRFGFGPAVYMPIVDAAMALLSLLPVWAAWRLGDRAGGRFAAMVCALLVALSPELIFFGPKTLTEIQAGNILAAAVALATILPYRPRAEPRHWALLGLLLGVTFCLRFHLTPALVLVALAGARLRLRRRWLPLCLGALGPLLLLGLVDQLTWGAAYQSVWKNFTVNLTEGRSLAYGAQPGLFYLLAWAHLLGLSALPLAILFFIGAALLPLAACTCALIVLTHSLVAHKELSFIYAAFPLGLITAGAGLARLARLLPRLNRAAALAAIALICAAAAATGDVPVMIRSSRDFIAIQNRIRTAPDLCGLVLDYGPSGFWPAYALTGRDVPVVFATSFAAGNYILANRSALPPSPQPEQCWKDQCLLHRPGSCAPDPADEINQVLQRAGD